MKKFAFFIALLSLSSVAYAAAPEAMPTMGMDHAMHHRKQIKDAPSTIAYKQVMETMHQCMMMHYSGDADQDFVVGMVPHHQGAVDMAKVELRYGKDPVMRAFAEWIIKWQTAEIGEMQSFYTVRSNGREDIMTPAAQAYSQEMQHMHHAMMIDYTGDADIDFARGMIPHHQGAIEMARTETRYGIKLPLRYLADSIFTSQQQEVAYMKAWLNDPHSVGLLPYSF